MKKLFYSLLFLLTSTVFMQAQDVITKHDGEDIQAKILEVNQNEIKYKRSNNPDGPTFTISKSEVLMVRYADGSKDLFNTTPQQPVVQQQPATQPRQQQTYQPAQQQAYQQPAAQPRNNTAQPDGTFAGEMRNMFRKDPNASISYGIRAGFNLSSFRGTLVNYYFEDDSNAKIKARPGFQIGAIVDIPVTYGFYVQPGLYFTTRGARYIIDEKDSYYYDSYAEKVKFRPFYLQVPVLASFRANVTKSLQVQLNTGPYLAVGLGGKVASTWEYTIDGTTTTGSSADEEVVYKFFGTKESENVSRFGAKRFDFGWCFGAGLTISGGFYVGIQYDLGCVNMLLQNDDFWEYIDTMYNGNFAIQAGYNF